jgi:NAD(P)H-dependent flavin oxidoreductase YrpB (nitropropane dioxygenase family)
MQIKTWLTERLGIRYPIIPGKLGSCEDYASRVEAALSEKVEVIFTSAHDGSPIGQRVKEAGCLWIHKCAMIKHAVAIAKRGADAVVVVGLEGAGFKGQTQNTTLVNMTALRRMIDTPLIAAGGIGDGRGLASSLAMGACGVYLGTAFMATKECGISEKWKQTIASQDVSDPDYHSRLMSALGKESILHSMASGMIDTIPTVADRLEGIMDEACEVIRNLNAACR